MRTRATKDSLYGALPLARHVRYHIHMGTGRGLAATILFVLLGQLGCTGTSGSGPDGSAGRDASAGFGGDAPASGDARAGDLAGDSKGVAADGLNGDIGGSSGDVPSSSKDVAGSGGDVASSTADAANLGDAADAPLGDAADALGGDAAVFTGTLSAAESAAYFPFSVGARWFYRVTGTTNGSPTGPRLTNREVTGTKAFASATAAVIRGPEGLGSTAIERYFEVAANGIVDHGSDATSSYTYASQYAIPYTAIPFPIKAGSTYVPFDIANVGGSQDLDADGLPDAVRASATATLAFEHVTVPVGTFQNALRVETVEDLAVTYSKTGSVVSRSKRRTIEWYASGVGPIKRYVEVTDPMTTSTTTTSELIAYSVGAVRHGVIPTGWLGQNLDQAGNNPYTPNRPAIGFDGKEFLVIVPISKQTDVATCTGNLQAVVVDLDGKTVTSAPLLDASNELRWVSIAWDGTRYLVAYDNATYHRLEMITVSSAGQLITGPVVLETGGATPSVVATKAGFLVAYVKPVAQPGTIQTLPSIWLAKVDGSAHPTSRVEPFPGAKLRDPVLAKDDADGVMALFCTPPATPSPTLPETANILAAARMTGDGQAVDAAPFEVASMPKVGHDQADLVFDGTAFVASWVRPGSTSSAVHVARFTRDGTLLDGPASTDGLVVGDPNRPKSTPRIARLGAGSLMVWGYRSAKDYYVTGIGGARFTSDGKLPDIPGDDDGRWFVSDFGASSYGLPEVLWGGDRALLVWVTQAGANDTFGMASGVAYPW